jgi:perosamine synthetase
LVLDSYYRDDLIKYLSDNNIQTRPIWGLIHEQKPYKKSNSYRVEKAFEYHNKIINIPCSTNLDEIRIYKVIDLIKRFLSEEIN